MGIFVCVFVFAQLKVYFSLYLYLRLYSVYLQLQLSALVPEESLKESINNFQLHLYGTDYFAHAPRIFSNVDKSSLDERKQDIIIVKTIMRVKGAN